MPTHTSTTEQLIKITPFTSHPGLYFEHIGEVSMVSNEWNIIAYYDLKNYWKELKGFRQCIANLLQVCERSNRKDYCNQIYSQLYHQLEVMEHNNEILYKNEAIENKGRAKRAPLEFIGNVANTLFGILDQNDAKHFEEQIGKVKVNEEYLLELMKNQTLIMDVTTNVIKKNFQDIHSQFEIFNKHINEVINNIDVIEKEHQEMKLQQIGTMLSIQATLMMFSYQRTQEALLQVVMDVQHQKIHPSLLTPTQLRSQLSIIRENLPATLSVPGEDKQTDLVQLYNVMTAKARVTLNYALFSIRIPLLNSAYFQLFKLYPIPTPHKDNFIFIDPSSEYLIVNMHRDHYYPLSRNELQTCRNFKEETYLCKQRHPIYNLHSNVSHCEMMLLNHHPDLSPHCRVRKAQPSKFWIQLQQPNSWIYILDKDYVFNIVCGRQILTKQLEGAGILKLKSNCDIRQKSMTITSHNIYSSNLNSSLIPLTNLSQQLETSPFNVNKNLSATELVWNYQPQEFSAITKAIADHKEVERLPEKLSQHHIHHYAVTYSLFGAFIIVAGGYFLRKYIHKTAKQKPTPAIRQHKPPPTTMKFEIEEMV